MRLKEPTAGKGEFLIQKIRYSIFERERQENLKKKKLTKERHLKGTLFNI